MNVKIFPKVSRWFNRLDSTNAEAIRAINGGEGPAAGAVFGTEEQWAGRGQGSNRWHATPGDNLTLSIVTYPVHLPLDRLFALTQMTGLAVADTVQRFLPDRAAEVALKWPNDVYVGEQKIAGILVQNGLRGGKLAWSVLGIGLNVNETNFPEPLTETATSLKLLAGSALDRDTVAEQLFANLSHYYECTTPSRLPGLDATYHERLYRKDVFARYQDPATGELFSGTIRGVAPSGQLRMVLASGREHLFSLRELAFVR